MFDPRSLRIYIDGSCLKNPGGPGGFCAWLEYPFYDDKPPEHLESRGYFSTTNNRMELRACLFVHEWILENQGVFKVQHVQIVSDSKYVCDGYQWCLNWSGRGWSNQFGRKMENSDLWKELLRTRKKFRGKPRISLVKIERRSSQLAKNVDDGAKRAATQPTFVDDGYQPGKVGKARLGDRRAAKPYPAAGEKLVVKIYGTRIVGPGVQSVKFEPYSETEGQFREKFSAQTTDDIANSLHRGNVFVVQMNDAPQNPRIVEIIQPLDRKAYSRPQAPTETESRSVSSPKPVGGRKFSARLDIFRL